MDDFLRALEILMKVAAAAAIVNAIIEMLNAFGASGFRVGRAS